MKSFEEIKEIIKNQKEVLERNFGVKTLGIFGSYVRQENKKESDLDVLIELKEDYKTFDNYMDIKFYLEEILNIKVDLITFEALKPRLKPYIMEEVVYV